MPKVRASSGNNWHDQLADFRIAQQLSQQANEDHGRRNFAAFGAFVKFLEVRFGNRRNRLGANLAFRQIASQLLAPVFHVFNFRAFVGGTIKRRVVQFVIGNRNSKARTEHFQLIVIQLFLLVGDVLAFARFAQSVAFDRFRQNDGRRTLVLHGCLVSRMDLDGIVAAQPHARQLLIGKMLNHFQQSRIGAEEVLPEVSAALDEIFLILAVADLAHALDQQAIAIAPDQAVPVAAPDHLDHIPAGAAENGFQFLNNLAIAAYRAVQPLQVAVHHEDQIVEPLARSQGDRAERLRLVHFAVAEERPHFAVSRQLQPAIFQITDKPRLVDCLNRSESHRDRGKLPEIRHQPGMGIRRKTAAGLQFAAKVLQFLPGNSAFKIRPSIHARRGVPLKIDQVAVASFGLGAQKMVKRHFVQSGGRGKSRNMPANAFLQLVGADHHGKRIPAHQALDAALHLLTAGKGGLCTEGIVFW